MSREEIEELLKQIKAFYPRFEGVQTVNGAFQVNPDVTDSWFRRIGYMSADRARKVLDSYLESDDAQKVPHVSLWVSEGQNDARVAHATAVFDRRRGIILWTPDADGKTTEIPVTWNARLGAYMDAEGRLWAFPGT